MKYPKRNPYSIAPRRMFDELKANTKIRPNIHGQAFKGPAFDLREEVLAYEVPEIDGSEPYNVNPAKQIDVFDAFLDNPLEPEVYIVGSKFSHGPALQLAAYMCLYWTMTCTVHSIKDMDYPDFGSNRITKTSEWFGIHSGYDYAAQKQRNPLHSTAFPVFYNVMENSDNRVIDKLRDALSAWSAFPRIVVYSGVQNPEEFNMRRLFVDANHIWLGQSRMRSAGDI